MIYYHQSFIYLLVAYLVVAYSSSNPEGDQENPSPTEVDQENEAITTTSQSSLLSEVDSQPLVFYPILEDTLKYMHCSPSHAVNFYWESSPFYKQDAGYVYSPYQSAPEKNIPSEFSLPDSDSKPDYIYYSYTFTFDWINNVSTVTSEQRILESYSFRFLADKVSLEMIPKTPGGESFLLIPSITNNETYLVNTLCFKNKKMSGIILSNKKSLPKKLVDELFKSLPGMSALVKAGAGVIKPGIGIILAVNFILIFSNFI